MSETINCICEYELDGTPVKLCTYHQKAAKTIATGARDAERESICQILDKRGLEMRMRQKIDEGMLLAALAKEIRCTKRPITINLLKANREELRK